MTTKEKRDIGTALYNLGGKLLYMLTIVIVVNIGFYFIIFHKFAIPTISGSIIGIVLSESVLLFSEYKKFKKEQEFIRLERLSQARPTNTDGELQYLQTLHTSYAEYIAQVLDQQINNTNP